MNWAAEHSMWILFGLLMVTAFFVVSVAVRNARSKTEQGGGSHSEVKYTGATPLKKTDKF